MDDELVDDPLFRQRYRFSRHDDTLRIEIETEPGGGVLAEHVHPKLEERYEIRDGQVTFSVDGDPVRVGPGERLVVAPGVRHRFENTGSGTARLVVEADPAMRLRESIEDGAALTRAGGFTEGGKPKSVRGLIEASALAQRYRDTVVLSSPPPIVQRVLFPLLARFASSGSRADG